MTSLFDIPLGWLQLKREKLRFAVALLGVSFAVVLILMQIGFREALFNSAVRFHDTLNADLVLIAHDQSNIVAPRSFSQRRLYQARGVAGVAAVTPLYVAIGNFENPQTHGARGIFVVGIDPSGSPLRLDEVNTRTDEIARQDTAFFDALSRPEFGPIAEQLATRGPISVDVNHREIQLAGVFHFGTSFGIDGTLITSETNFLRIFPNRERGLIEVGIVRIEPGQDPIRVRDAIRTRVERDVLVLTREEFRAREIAYWDSATPIGYVFSFGVIVGLVVGGIIVYQILFADVNDHLPEYATLKAMGYSNGFLAGVVIQQAVILATLGFLPAVGISLVLYRISGEATRLPLEMTKETALFVFGLTVLMCTISALMALRKVRSADPAEIF